VRSTLYRNGVVHSPADPFAEAVVVADGVVAWLGADEAADRYVRDVDEVVDLAGALVTPGFVDAHAHLLRTGIALAAVDLSDALGPADVLAAVAAAAPAGGAVVGHGWDDAGWSDRTPPTAQELTRAAGGRPVLVVHADQEVAWGGVDVLHALDLAPDADLRGTAVSRALEVVQAGADRERLHTAALGAAAAAGIVCVHEHSSAALDSRAGLAALLATTAHPDSGLPAVVGYRAELCETVDDAREVLAAIPGLTGIGGDLAVDGTVRGRGAAVRHAYAGGSGTGRLMLTAEQVANHVASVVRAGAQPGFRVAGDRGLDEVLLGLRAATDVEGVAAVNAAGLRLEGLGLVDAPALAALVLLGVRAAVLPAHVVRHHEAHLRALGPARLSALLPLADLAAAGVPTAFGSGSPSMPFDPWAAVAAAVLHPEPEQRLSGRAALRAHTRAGWRLARQDGPGAGEIRLGSPADLAIWRTGPLGVQAPEGRLSAWSTDARAGTPQLPLLGPDLPRPVCARTLRAGRVIFDSLG
jgi:predicted amidohydrolase YtcJ